MFMMPTFINNSNKTGSAPNIFNINNNIINNN